MFGKAPTTNHLSPITKNRAAIFLRGQFDGVFVPENANRLLELIGLERFLQNRDRPLGQNPVEHFAIGITRNNNDWALGLFPLGLIVNVVSRAVRQFQIEKNEVELLFVERGQRFFDRSNYHAAASDLLKKKFEEILQTLVVVDHEHGGLAGFVLLENVFVEGRLFDSPASTDLDGWKLPALDEIINGRQRDAQVFGRFLDRQEIMHGRKSASRTRVGKTFRCAEHYKF